MNSARTERCSLRSHSRGLFRTVALLLVALQVLALAPVFAGGDGREEYDPVEGLRYRSPSEDPEAGTVDVHSRLNVRDGPGLDHSIIGKLYPGDKLKILATENGWHKIMWNGRVAWCCAYWVHSAGEQWNNEALAGGGGGSDGNDSGGKDKSLPGGSQPVAGGPLLNMPLINQNTGGGSYPSGYCGPTTCRMVLSYYGIRNTTADQIALGHYGPGTPMYQRGQGSTHAGMASALRHFGLNADLTYTHSISALRSAVSKGHPVIINLHGNYGPFYTDGHITVVVGFTENGSAIINDSAGGVRRTIPASVLARTWNGLFIEVSK